MYETPKSKTTFSPLHISPELASIAEGLTKFSGANNQLILNAFKSSSAFKDQLKANGALFELSGLAAKLGQFIKPATIGDFCTARAPKTEIPKITFKN